HNPTPPKPQIPKTPKPQNPKTPKPQNPKTPKPQNPKTPKPQNPKTPKPQNPVRITLLQTVALISTFKFKSNLNLLFSNFYCASSSHSALFFRFSIRASHSDYSSS